MENLVQSTISSLGYLEKGIYYKEPDCFESIRDLIRLLHGDDPKLSVRRMCLSRNIVNNDLVPIMKTKDTSDELFDAVLRLTVNLCQPSLIALNGKSPENVADWEIYYGTEKSLAHALVAFADPVIFDVLSAKCHTYFSTEWVDRTEKQKLLIERIFVLLRYVFAIGTENGRYIKILELEGPLKGKVLLCFFQSQFSSIFLSVSKQTKEKEFCLHILSILSLAFNNIDGNTLMLDEKKLLSKEKEETEKELSALVDSTKREEQAVRYGAKRGFLKGTFVVKGVKALAPSNDLVVQKCGTLNLDDISPVAKLTKRKLKRKIPQNRRVVDLEEINVSVKKEVNAELVNYIRQFCLKMLENDSYNKLMKITRDIAFSNGRSLTHKYSEIHFFTLSSFMMLFCRVAKISCSKVTSTFSTEFFHHVIMYIDTNFENMKIDKSNIRIHAFKTQFAFAVYKEMLILLNMALSSENEIEKELSKCLCNHIFQVEEYRDLGFSIMNLIKPAATTRKMLHDLVLSNHYYLHIMEKASKVGNLVKVKKSKKVFNRRKKELILQQNLKEDEKAVELSTEELQLAWEIISKELPDVLNGKCPLNDEISPINCLLKVDDEQHQAFAMLQIQMSLRQRRVCDGIGIYRAARTLWPETGAFGDDSLSPEDEFRELNELFFTDLSEIGIVYNQCMKEAYGHGANHAETTKNADDEIGGSVSDTEKQKDDNVNSNSDKEEENAQYIIVEIPFDFDGYVMNFAKPHVIFWYIFLLKDFQHNSSELNKAILKIMHRIAFDLKSPSRLYMASLFCIFKRVNDVLNKLPKELRKQQKFYELYIFGFHLIRKFFTHYKERGSVLICELLLNKTAQDSYEIEHGYGSYDSIKESKGILWTEELEEEFKSLYYEFTDLDDKPENMDIVDFIEHNLAMLVTHKQVIRKLKELGLPYAGSKRKSKTSTQKMLSVESSHMLDQLVKEFKSLDDENKKSDLIDYIESRLPDKYSRQRIIKYLSYKGVIYENNKGIKRKSKHSNKEGIKHLKRAKIIESDEDESNDEDLEKKKNVFPEKKENEIVQNLKNQVESSSEDSEDELNNFFKTQRYTQQSVETNE